MVTIFCIISGIGGISLSILILGCSLIFKKNICGNDFENENVQNNQIDQVELDRMILIRIRELRGIIQQNILSNKINIPMTVE